MASPDRVQRSFDFIGVAAPSLVYVGLAERAAFDRIAAPCWDHGENESGHVLTKTVDDKVVCVVFQHWLKSLTPEAWLEVQERKRAEAHGDRQTITSAPAGETRP